MNSISIVIPLYNETNRLPAAMDQIIPFMDDFDYPYEIILVENRSIDDTWQLARDYQRAYRTTVRALQSMPGKGAAIKTGMLAARGEFRYMCDVDLSTPINEIKRFRNAALYSAPIVIGSREVQGSQRINEPENRHTMGRVFNAVIQSLLIAGISDSQCGFKMFRADAAEQLFSRLTIDGWAFDVELLYLARRMGYHVREMGVPWQYESDSRVRPGRDALEMLRDVLKIKINCLSGKYNYHSELVAT